MLKDGLNGQALPDNTAVIQLDTQVLPELEREGIARDFVRMIQAARKEQGFDISDRICLYYQTDSALIKEAVAEHQKYICEQVLATQLSAEKALTTPITEELGDSSVSFELVKK